MKIQATDEYQNYCCITQRVNDQYKSEFLIESSTDDKLADRVIELFKRTAFDKIIKNPSLKVVSSPEAFFICPEDENPVYVEMAYNAEIRPGGMMASERWLHAHYEEFTATIYFKPKKYIVDQLQIAHNRFR